MAAALQIFATAVSAGHRTCSELPWADVWRQVRKESSHDFGVRSARVNAKPCAIIFDFGGVVIHWDPRRVYRGVLETDEAIEAFFREIGFREWNQEQDRGLRCWSAAVAEPVGSIKPEREIFDLTLERIGCRAGDCLFIDDHEPNVAAATDLGFHAIRFTSSKQLEENLRGAGVLP